MNDLYIAQRNNETGNIDFFRIDDKISVPSKRLSPISHIYSKKSSRTPQYDTDDQSHEYKYSVFAEENIIWTAITGKWFWSVKTWVDEDMYMVCNPDLEDTDELSMHEYIIAFDATITVKQEFGLNGLSASVSASNTADAIWLPNVSCGMLCSGIDRDHYTLLSPTQLIGMLNGNRGNMDYHIEAAYELDSLEVVNKIKPEYDEGNTLPNEFANICRMHSLQTI